MLKYEVFDEVNFAMRLGFAFNSAFSIPNSELTIKSYNHVN